MFGFIIILHTIVCMLLVMIILMQSGRGGGLTESFSAAESMFGAKTNIVLVKATTVLASLFLVTCLSLAFLSARSNKSLIKEKMADTTMPAKETDLMGNVATAAKEASSPTSATVTTDNNMNPNPAADTQKTGEKTNLETNETKQATNPAQTENPQ